MRSLLGFLATLLGLLTWFFAAELAAADSAASVVARCDVPVPPGESSQARLTRKGWRRTRAEILNDGAWLKTADIAQGRDLRRYRIEQLLDPEMARAYRGEGRIQDTYPVARNFLWKHWRARRPAYLMLTGQAIGAVTTAHIFIEPEAGSDRWRITWRVVRSSGFVDDLPVFYEMRWIPDARPRPDAAGAKSKVLEFLDRCGESGATL
jgi:hypothetical protein